MLDVRSRARGCLLGQLAGDSLGSLVEFRTPQSIHLEYPNGVRFLADGGTFNTIAGQPTDDSEMALALAGELIKKGRYCVKSVKRAYQEWLASNPFDCGSTISNTLYGELNPYSEANGALMRISPLGIFGSKYKRSDVMKWAKKDAEITHIHPICGQINALFVALLAHAIREGGTGAELYKTLLDWMKSMKLDPVLHEVVKRAAYEPPSDFITNMGWVLIAFQNAIYQMLHAPNLEEGVIDTVMRGGDTDTNAAIAGTLLGAIYGEDAVPVQWRESILNCRPEVGRANCPRPEKYWPNNAIKIADLLLRG